ncbi:MAG: hypothetical protein IPJ19_11830 [Planctomycetes bacterium]|nr:hypothetical protein [Planctomycetota bacterium]
MRWILACIACVFLALCWESKCGAGRPGELALDPTAAAAAPSEDPLTLLESAKTSPRARVPAAEVAVGEEPAAEDLVAILRRIALSYSAQDSVALGAALEALLREPARCEEALALLAGGALQEDEVARAGCVLGLGAAVSCYSSAGCTVAVDGHAFTVHVLEALAAVAAPEQQDLAQQLIEARAGERFVLDLSFLGKILELRGLHPEQAELYSSLLVHMAENLADGRGLEEFRALFLTEGQDPTAVKLSLSALLRTDAASWLPLAENLFADSRGNAALRSAIAYAIATSAPVDLAALSLARLANSSMYNEFTLLGMREGGAEALAERYSDLVSAGGNPLARKMIVSGLQGEGEPVLLGIARTDPDVSVRSQALLTSSLGRASGTELLNELESMHGLRTDSAQGIPTRNAVLVAGNVLINSGNGERERAKTFLMRIAEDSSESDADRLAAVHTLLPWVPAGSFDGWVIGGQSVK